MAHETDQHHAEESEPLMSVKKNRKILSSLIVPLALLREFIVFLLSQDRPLLFLIVP